MGDKRAVIYARFSSEKQAKCSIDQQVKECKACFGNKGYMILPHVYKDEAQTGKTDNRAQLQKMLADSKKNQFDAVLIYSLDRFGRNLYQCLTNEIELQSNGVTVLSATEHFENTPAGRFQRNMMLSNAQYYSEELGLKTTRGMDSNADHCYTNGGTVPLGYKTVKIDPNNEKSKKKFVVDEERAEIVREIYKRYAKGDSQKDICDSLNERGFKTGKNVAFNKSSLNALLQNRRYLGFYIYNGREIPNSEMQIIDKKTFDDVAKKLKMHKKAPRMKEDYLLTTKLFCGHCKDEGRGDVLMVGHSSNKKGKGGIKYSYYKCKKQGSSHPCKKKMVHKDYIENTVVDKCREYLTPQNIRRIAKQIVNVAESYDDKAELNRLSKRLQEAQKAKDNHLISLRMCDDLTREMLIEDLGKVGAEIKMLERQLEIEKSKRYTVSEEKIIDTLTRLADGDINDMVYRRSLIGTLVNRIYLYDDMFTMTINMGDEDIEITDRLLSEINENLLSKEFCAINSMGHHVGVKFALLRRFFIKSSSVPLPYSSVPNQTRCAGL